jgi:hypothetical protein
MPVTRDSDDWKNLTATVTRIDRDVTELAKTQSRQHTENSSRMDVIEKTQQKLSQDVAEINRIITRVEGAFDGAKAIGKVVAWLLATLIALQTINTLYGPTIRKSLNLPNATNTATPGAVSSNQPQSAHIPTL